MKIYRAILVGVMAAALGVAAAAPRVVSKLWTRTFEGGKIKYSYQYPQVRLASPEVESRVNRTLMLAAMPTAAEMADMQSSAGLELFDSGREFTVGCITDRLVSVYYHGLEVARPAAHPNKFDTAVTIDLRTGRTIGLADLFRPGSDYKNRIKDLARPLLRKILVVESGPNDDVDGILSQAFRDGIHFYLRPHKLCLYDVWDMFALNSVRTDIDTSLLQDMVRPNGPLSGL